MNKILSLVFSIFISISAYSQIYQNTNRINQSDTFLLNKAILTDNNELISASLENREYPVGGIGVLGVYSPGSLVLRMLDSNLAELWNVSFPESKAVVLDIKLHNNNVIIAGAYYDTLAFPNSDTLFGDDIRANEFIASFDLSGNYNWSYANSYYEFYTKYISKFFILNNKIYYPYSTDTTTTSIQVLNLNGDSLDNFQLSESRILISDIEVDSNNDVYFAGTGEPDAIFAGDSIFHTQQNINAYMTFLVKTDSNLNQLWSKGFNHVTFDLHPEIEVFNDDIAFLYNHSEPQNINSVNYFALNFYEFNSSLIRHDSVGEGFFSHMHKHKALYSANNLLYLSKTTNFNQLGVYSINNQYNYQLLSSIESHSVKGIPGFTANSDQLLLTYSFNDEYAIINDTDTFWNTNYMIDSNYWSYQQVIMKHLYDSTTTSVNNFSENNKLVIYPNPTNGLINIKNDNKIRKVEAYNINGQLVYSKNINNYSHSFSFEYKGVYLLRITTNYNLITRKVISN